MAGGKKKKDFSTSPFRQLKGFCASGGRDDKAVTPPPPSAEPEPESEVDFVEAMARLGIKGKRNAVIAPPARRELDISSPPAPVDEQTLFLATIGSMETTFVDEVPETPARPVTPRFKKLLRGNFLADAELDLHGFDRLRARERVRYFLENAVHQGKKTALLITGRGHGSTGEPVLRNEVEKFLLREAGPWVSEWESAPRQYGGDGAFVLLLRTKKK